MNLTGTVRSGAIILDENCALPDGTFILVTIIALADRPPRHRKAYPIVPSDNPGSVQLTNEMIGQILDAEDAAGGQRS